MKAATIILEILGGLAVFLYGIDLTSDGIQRAAGERMQKIFNLIMKNRFLALFTGCVVTMLIQSSSALTVITVSFVNAGMISLKQAIGVIMGANIGTTITAWIVAVTNAKSFSIAIVSIPLFGIGYFLSILKNSKDAVKSTGIVFMGFSLIFLGLSFISKAIPKITAKDLEFLQHFTSSGFAGILLSVFIGTLFTIIVHSSSGSMAIIITLASQGVIDVRMAAGLTLGANIGTTIDAFLATINAGTNAKRAAWAHILFNIIGSVWVIILFNPFLALIQKILPQNIGIAYTIAMFHLVFNIINSVLFLPFVKPFAKLLCYFIKEKKGALAEFTSYPVLVPSKTPQLSLIQANKEIFDMSTIVKDMFLRFESNLKKEPKNREKEIQWFSVRETYLDQMRENLTHFLLEIARHDITNKTSDNIGNLIHLVDAFESISDSCMNLANDLERSYSKKLTISKNEAASLAPYTTLVEETLTILNINPVNGFSSEQLKKAKKKEDEIDEMCRALKKKAANKLQTGANVKTELLLIDMIRHIEKIGDFAFTASRALRNIK